MNEVRLNKFIADAGLASRRHADKMIEAGEVSVNGKKVYELGKKIDPLNDRILVRGKPVKIQHKKLYYLFNKPKGVLTTLSDPEDRPNVSDYIQKIPGRVFPVGRLDWDSEGLILLTNDGDFANRVMHPKQEVTKTYLVKLDGHPKPEQIRKLLTGVTIIGGKTAARHVEKIHRKEGSDKYDWYKMVITEGKNRQIRRMFEKIGFDVIKLQRVAIGRLRLGSTKRGDLIPLDETDLKKVFLPDDPEEIKIKKSYKGRQISLKRVNPSRQQKSRPKDR